MMSAQPDDKFDDELLSAYVDNELDAHERAAVEERLRTDERTRQLLQELRQASEAVRSLPRQTAPRELRDNVLAAIEQVAFEKDNIERATTLPMSVAAWQRRMTPRTWALAAFAVAAALMLTVVLPRRVDEHRPLAQASKEKTASEPNDFEQETTSGVAAPAMAPAPASDNAEKLAGGEAEAPRPLAAGTAAPPAEARGGGGRFTEGAPRDMRRQRAELSSKASPAAGAPAAPLPPAESPAEESLEVHVVDEANASRFEQLLAAQGITLREDQPPADVAASLAEVAGDDDASPEPVLVEATRAQVDALVQALGPDRDASTLDNVRLQSRGRAVNLPAGRAWRLPHTRTLAESAGAQPAAAAAPAPAEAAAQPEKATTDGEQREGTVRVLFFLRRPTIAR
jgi:hypothetical protein